MGPIAPKDPVRQREFFYIMLDKQISAAPAPEGRGCCVIYENDERLVTSAKIVGNVSDSTMLDMLRKTDSFRKLVYGLGVSVMCREVDTCDFVFQMYGRTDAYVTGTNIRQTVSADGAEYLIPFSEIDWSDDDDIPGQIRFEFAKSGFLATVNVRLYLNDGYKAPPFEEPDPIDTGSPAFRDMIKKSLVSKGSSSRLKKLIECAEAGEDLTLAFIGGSITQGAGATPINTECYAKKTFESFEKKYMKGGKASYIKAGVGGTPSELGIVRFDRDVLGYGKNSPDLVVVEFAVNDAGDETEGDCYEGLVRTILNLPSHPAVILIFAVFADDYNLEDRLIPIGEHYGLPMTSVKRAVTPQFYLSKAEGRVLAKSSYFYDVYHPSNTGHIIMSECIMNVIDEVAADRDGFSDTDYVSLPALRSADFEGVHPIDRKENRYGAVIEPGDFNGTDTQLQACEMNMDPGTTPQFADNWMHTGGNRPFVMDVTCRRLLIVTKDSADLKDGRADIYVDGKFVKTVDPHAVGWCHCNAQIIVRDRDSAKHHIEVRMHEGDGDKQFTILGFGLVE
ncbi:MAG: SGNH/GDSL hydrolase family protein [Lachnospiraceae bacterium]|nr:SGNH/GDSL hydrolase family protein [Lachnospiraceae bacterium]